MPKILDAKGRPYQGQHATVLNDYQVEYMGNMILNTDFVLTKEGRGQGVELFEMLLRDDQVASTMQTRKLAVTGREWGIDAADPEDAQAKKIAEFVHEAFEAFDLDGAVKSLLNGIVLGYKPAEIMWALSEGSVWVDSIIGQPARRYNFDLDGKLLLRTKTNMIFGEPVPDRKFVVYRNTDPNGSPYGEGLGRYLYWPVWFKKNAIKFWLIFADKFGSPTVLGRYPAGNLSDSPERAALMQALDAIQQESTVTIPQGMEIELLEAKRAGRGDTYDRLTEYFDKAITKVVLGHAASADATPGRLGNENRAQEVAEEYTKADAANIAICLNATVVKWLVEYNFGPQKAYPRFWYRLTEEPDLTPQAERDKILIVDIGLEVPKKYLYETYAIPAPEKGDEIVGAPAPTPAALLPFTRPGAVPAQIPPGKGSGKAPGKKPGQAQGKEPVDDQEAFAEATKILSEGQDAVDDLMDNLDPAYLQAQARGILKPVIDMIEAGQDYAQVAGALLEVFPSMDSGTLERILAKAIFVHEMLGRWEAQTEG